MWRLFSSYMKKKTSIVYTARLVPYSITIMLHALTHHFPSKILAHSLFDTLVHTQPRNTKLKLSFSNTIESPVMSFANCSQFAVIWADRGSNYLSLIVLVSWSCAGSLECWISPCNTAGSARVRCSDKYLLEEIT